MLAFQKPVVRRFVTAVALVASFAASRALAGSWSYNMDGGFGIYQPEGWSIEHEGRRSVLTGPERDSAQTEISIGSDWQSKVTSDTELKSFLQSETGAVRVDAFEISGLKGYRTHDSATKPTRGAIYVLREPQNVIEIEYDIRGSRDQVDEGRTALGSIEIRTKPKLAP